MSASVFTVLWPLPLLDMMGFTTHGNPMFSMAAKNSSFVAANSKGDVRSPSSSAAKRRMPSRFIVSCAARAVGMISTSPAASIAASVSVAIASTSGTTKCGRSCSITARNASPSSIEITWARSATCIAGALAYASTAITSTPYRCSSITTSLPNSPDPHKNTRLASSVNGVPIVLSMNTQTLRSPIAIGYGELFRGPARAYGRLRPASMISCSSFFMRAKTSGCCSATFFFSCTSLLRSNRANRGAG